MTSIPALHGAQQFVIPVAHAGRIAEATPLSTVVVHALEFLLTISGTIGIISLVITGIMYLFAAQSGNGGLQSAAKKSFTFAIIGIAAIMSAMVLLRLVARLLTTGGN